MNAIDNLIIKRLHSNYKIAASIGFLSIIMLVWFLFSEQQNRNVLIVLVVTAGSALMLILWIHKVTNDAFSIGYLPNIFNEFIDTKLVNEWYNELPPVIQREVFDQVIHGGQLTFKDYLVIKKNINNREVLDTYERTTNYTGI